MFAPNLLRNDEGEKNEVLFVSFWIDRLLPSLYWLQSS
jgi:hypothetical protein